MSFQYRATGYSELDPENPKNWSEGKKLLVLVQIG